MSNPLSRIAMRVAYGASQLPRVAWYVGHSGVYSLAAVIGITDIDPFVLNLAQGGTLGVPGDAIASAILIAASSNNLLKAVYAASFAGGRATMPSVAALVVLALGGIAIAIAMGGLWAAKS
jgi:uncharacterized membrane protein (DUF4010 family)